MKTRFNLFRRDNGVFYSENTTNGKQSSLRTKDETEARSLINARNEAQRQPVLNLHLARAYLTASDPAFVERTWQVVMEQMQSRGKESSRERYASVFKSPSYDGFRATASTILNEQGFGSDEIERQLAHVERNKVRAA